VWWEFFFLAHSPHCLIKEFFFWCCLKSVLLHGTLTVLYDETVSVNCKVTLVTQQEICSFRPDTCSFFGAFFILWCAWLDSLSIVGVPLSPFLSITYHLPNFLLLSQSKQAFRYNPREINYCTSLQRKTPNSSNLSQMSYVKTHFLAVWSHHWCCTQIAGITMLNVHHLSYWIFIVFQHNLQAQWCICPILAWV
jgi:hypothetical protein